MLKNKSIGLLIGIGLMLTSCGEKSTPSGGESFDRLTLLEQVAERRIKPAFDSFSYHSNQLEVRAETFVQNKSAEHLALCQEAWKKTFMAFQQVRMFNFGPGEKSLIGDVNENLGTWPIDTNGVESRIIAGDLTMLDFRRDSRGLLAVEYLLFHPEASARFSGADSLKRSNYLLALTTDISTWANEVNQAWLNQLGAFKADNSKSAGSSTSELYNHFLMSYESIKNYQVALPAGLLVGQTQADPSKVQNRYSRLSLEALKAHLSAIEAIWLGTALDGSTGIGFDDYLDKVSGGAELKQATLMQWQAIHQQLDAIPDDASLQEMVVQDPEKVAALFAELQKMTRFLKSDLSSLLGIAITFSSGDGD
ncbi:MAG: imelysin family protein [Bacteroidota bacterium]|nr:imelysin family protein [Bacteroidota bacterium]MDX5430337.1 imelysin family protein [Bacteroidota bacterium]MDX5469098.1 imelysin family protein [Bacteroidota bacterium]